ncbi:BZ3500_MvSof-1268-A1-R1_Chr11-3g03630 [Microbotryum saponariae]|uniref:BZ3500_MvSof-1268-A1-R1_Chr11-3g03618 protein n=1 Tax=Microbotryum saponariae TaxID=289078 RepID=A0A2X0NE84_9BASI|nr:BZ3500_MvSof-1268-A1-R1_Chr11-3g03618 [Microbotryum saponariae]SCZ95137.1 BZ3500_MvSof-1268-A1-R1_Chr11-3g03630 [Microbotryum saponariae]SDA03629.1 BZ3501_MvSof-1269-A2-R1_Chr11g03195 [Microbotryum saponariae]SDA03646.1 BZ3501_MvSof-1269-A2-R1_Chr11g03207 [Microbotryum saponariae]
MTATAKKLLRGTNSMFLNGWPNSPLLTVTAVVVLDDEAERVALATIALDWLAQSEDTYDWDYVHHVVQEGVEQAGYLGDEAGEPLDTDSPLREGNFTFVPAQEDVQFFTPTVGPVGEEKGELPRCFMAIDDNDNNTLCDSPPASEEEEMAICVVTDCTSATYCWPVHIVPPSRHDIWDKLGVSGRYELSAGLLLNLCFYTMFAHYAWSIYPLGDGEFVVHCFDPTIKTPLGESPHGYVITRERFNIQDDTELPHEDLLRWHYRQCVLRHLRGIAVLE